MELFRRISRIASRHVSLQKRWRASPYPGKKTDVQGINLHYEQVGNGPHKVLLLPGALGSGRTDFSPQLEQLDKSKFTIVAWDPPGYGFSRPPNRTFPRDFYYCDAHLASALMMKLGYKSYSALGWSDGGTTAVIMASHYPNTLEKLVVWGSSSYLSKVDLELLYAARDIHQWNKKMLEPLLVLYQEEYLTKMWQEYIEIAEKIVADGGDICKKELKKIVCPTLIVQGDKDPLVPIEQALYLLENINGSRLHRMPEGRHNLHLRYAKEFNELVTKFLLQ